MKTFRADGQPSRDDECEHGFRRFEKCPHCLEAENERLRSGRNACEEQFQAKVNQIIGMMDEIEKLREAIDDLAQYVSRADWFYLKDTTRAALGEEK